MNRLIHRNLSKTVELASLQQLKATKGCQDNIIQLLQRGISSVTSGGCSLDNGQRISHISGFLFSQRRHGTNMRVLLLKDLENKGKTGDIVTVRRGYARNKLIPGQIATYLSEEMKDKFYKELKDKSVTVIPTNPVVEETTNDSTTSNVSAEMATATI